MKPRQHLATRLPEFGKFVAMLSLLFLLAANARAQSALDGFDAKANGDIRVIVVQPDGKILIGGDFTTLSRNAGPTVARNHIARLNVDCTVDSTFNPNANGSVWSIAIQADGKILVGGDFNGANSIGGQFRNRIARLDATTGLADSFDPNAITGSQPTLSGVATIAIQADGKILVGGGFTGIGGQPRNNIARLDATTGLADSFDPNADSSVRSVVVQANGKILAGGDFGEIGGEARSNMARLDPTTGLADSFDPHAMPVSGFDSYVSAVTLQEDGRILAGGFFSAIGGQQRHRIARLDPATGLADSFDPNAGNDEKVDQSQVSAIAVQPDGKIVVGGDFTHIGGQARSNIARLDALTGLADSVNPSANGMVRALAVQADGKVLAGGTFNTFTPNGGPPVIRDHIARLESNGMLDQTLNSPVLGFHVDAIAVQADRKIVIGGDFYDVLGVPRMNIARLNADGTLDTGFDQPNLNNLVNCIAIQPDGKILVGGNFLANNGIVDGIARLDAATGAVDASFHPVAGATYAIAVQADGKILLGRNNLTRLNSDGSIDSSFNPNLNSQVLSIAVQEDGKILVGGFFTSVGGTPRNYLARLNPDGTLDQLFDPNVNQTTNNCVGAIAVQMDGKVVVGGRFSNIGGQARNNIARLDPVTGAADSFDPNANRGVWMIAIQADGKIVAGGDFDEVFGEITIGGQNRNYIARLDPLTGAADSFNPDPFGYVFSLALQADGRVLTGGAINAIGGQQRSLFARLSNDTAALQNLAATQTTVTWTLGGSSPQFARVTFESSTDNVNYTPLGEGSLAGNSWTLTGLNLPTGANTYIRARGFHRSGQYNASGSITEFVRNVFLLRPSTLGNISTRLHVLTGDNAMIGGFIITGTQPKTVVVRGIGPSLTVPAALADPVIEVRDSAGDLIAANDNWMDAATRQEIIDSGLAPANDLESALWGILDPGAYTVVVRGKNDATGIGLFEVYDLDQTVDSKLANISTRGVVETGNDVLIGGAIIIGNDPARLLLRAIGPSLTDFGLPNALGDPVLELHDGDGTLMASNDNWRTDQEAEILATGIPPSNDLESAIVSDLVPGNYTAIIRGVNNTTGVAVVEAFELH